MIKWTLIAMVSLGASVAAYTFTTSPSACGDCTGCGESCAACCGDDCAACCGANAKDAIATGCSGCCGDDCKSCCGESCGSCKNCATDKSCATTAEGKIDGCCASKG